MAGLLFTYFSRPVLGIFTDDPTVLDLAVRYTYVVLPFTWIYAIFNGIINFVNGLGEVRYPTIVNLLMLWAVRIPCAYLIAYYFDGGYVMAAIPISFVFGMISMFTYFLTKRWQNIKRLASS